MINDAHCHFFSRRFFETLAGQAKMDASVEKITATLGWEPPGEAKQLADRWAAELDRASVKRAALIASVPGDEESVVRAVERHPDRFVGFFMVHPALGDAPGRVLQALDAGLRTVCLFPAMHGFRLDEPPALKVFEAAASHQGAAVFVHCGALSVGVRKKLGLRDAFDFRLGNPLDLLPAVGRFPDLPILIPHFGAGFFREALMLADQHANVHFDTSSSNSWIKYHPGLTLEEVFRRAWDVLGPERLIFGSDSSFFPRGWNGSVLERQRRVFDALQLDDSTRSAIEGGNFERLFPVRS